MDLPLRAQLAQTLFLGVDGSSDADVRALVEGPDPVGGIFVSGTSTTVLTSGVLTEVSTGSLPALVALDDEGGRVQRIDGVVGPLPSGKDQGQLPPEQIRLVAAERGRQMTALGITMDFAPVVDLGGQPDNGVIGDRAYGTTVTEVVQDAGAFATGLRDAGVLPTLKHFPGHGRALGDSHLGAATTPSWEELREMDVLPYAALAKDPVAVMVGHLSVPGLSSDDLPTSLDPAAYRALREDVGFQGIAITDDLRMRAVSDSFGVPDAVRRALDAGADMVLLATPVDRTALLDTLVADAEAARLSPARVAEAAARVLAEKACVGGT